MHSGFLDLPWWGYLLATLAMTHVTIAGVTIFLHRHQAHRALELGSVPSHFFRLWLWLTTGMVTREWAAIHRKHHAKCETPEDPHSPQVVGLNRVLWTGVFLYVKESRNSDTTERYGHGTPDDWLERKLYTPLHKLGVVVMLGIDVALFGVWPGVLIWGVQMVWIPFWAAGVVNGIGHFWGYRNFACADASTNFFPLGILIGGEELHNNHHAFATSAKLSNKWYEFDIGWLYIRMMELLGMARVKKVAPKPRLGAIRPAIDLDMLQAIVTHRYDVLARYLKTLRQLAAEEFSQLKIDASEGRMMKRLLGADGAALPEPQKERLTALLARSERLARGYAMRAELEALWARSSASHDQLVKQLQDWVAHAEQSGIRQLEEFSRRLRSYAV
ncbi:fatty acid desaturase [Sulfuritalea sp.]|uniref:DesA family fatty acid desaturase n=1 Tax=Sulfuritalea sp. TaxID=2480090 RepID=UPI00286E2215|nr:fatty acid desaturase [Sulfuritalea sp.]